MPPLQLLLSKNRRVSARRLAMVTLLASATLIMACDGQGTGSGPGAVSEGEARALDEAAEMLEERNLPEGALPPTGLEAAPAEPQPEPLNEEVSESE
jgi:hypothetical protein